MAANGGLSRSARVAILLVLSGLAFVARVVPAYDAVFPRPDAVRLFGVDPYYHLRQAEYSAKHFPELQRWDVGTNFPDGQRSDAAGLFDLLIAGASRILGERVAVERVAAWTPVVLGVVSVVALYWLAAAVSSAPWALFASGIFVLYPGTALPRSMLGFSDHHAAEIVLALATVAAWVRCWTPPRAATVGVEWLRGLLAALPLALFLFTWVGAPLYLLLAGGVLAVLVGLRLATGQDVALLLTRSFQYATGLALWFGLAVVAFPDWVMEPALLPGIAAGILALGVVGPGLGLGLHRIASRTGRPLWVTLAAALGLVGLAAFVLETIPSLTSLASRLWSTKTSLLVEHAPVDWRLYWGSLGPVGLLALLALPLVLVARWRRDEAGPLVPVLAGSALAVLWWRTSDYAYVVPAFAALMATLALRELARAWRTADGDAPRVAILAACGLACLLPLWPLGWVTTRPWLSSQQIANTPQVSDAWWDSLEWLSRSTPEPALAVDARVAAWNGSGFRYPADSYGVRVGWEAGNWVSVLGRRVPVWSRWPSPENAAWFLAQDEAESLAQLCASCEAGEQVRYAIVDALTVADLFPAKVATAGYPAYLFQSVEGVWQVDGEPLPRWTYGPRYRNSIAARLYLDDGVGLSHYRLVYESPQQSYSSYGIDGDRVERRAVAIRSRDERSSIELRLTRDEPRKLAEGYEYGGIIASSVKIFEHVAGARLIGVAPPGARIEIELTLHSSTTERDFVYSNRLEVQAEGRFELAVPYATEGSDAAIAPRGAYRLRLSDPSRGVEVRHRGIEVAESLVQSGGRLELGELLQN